MEGEIKNFINIWITVFASLTYCYFIAAKIPKGKVRLLSLLPIICLFTILPFNLSSVHLGVITVFFITWLANFKLLLLAFDQGPLSSDPSIPLLRFISLACLPIKIEKKEHPSHYNTKKGLKSPLNYALKLLLFSLLIRIYDYKQHLHPYIILVLYGCHVYFAAEIILAMFAALARAFIGLELEPQFDEPYLSTSLQDFWGRRWNLMVTSILRPTVYEPTRCISARMVGRRWALLPAVLATFLVSGLMHELMYYSQTRVEPTWEVTWFFVLHGICTAMEIGAKKALAGRWQLHRAVSGPLVVGFVAVTSFWLFFPQILRNGVDVRVIRECGIVEEFFNDKVSIWGV